MALLDSYWPSFDEINRCIKSQAETASDEVLLAVHQTTPLIVREANLRDKVTTEHDLLNEFLREDLPEGMLLLPITGDSGVGKSHLIRWLDAQIKRDHRGSKMHVILIPKSASLREVVELILEPLKGDQRYDDVSKKLQGVFTEVNLENGVTLFSAAIKIALRNLAKKLTVKLKETNDRKLMLRIDHAKRLPDFFAEPELQEHFDNNVLMPIIKRAIKGGGNIQDQDSEEEFLQQFTVSDLTLPESISRSIGNASMVVRKYYSTVLNTGNGENKNIAVEVLNSVIDESIRQVFHLDQAAGGITLESIILSIRDVLFEDQKELVLLVEDFKALSGIQEVLLNVCIVEGEYDGKLIRAPMRTALAVTEGYLATNDTVLTRAKREWLIQSDLNSDEDVYTRCIEIVGAYLNASRWGRENLRQMFNQSSHDNEESLTNWVETFSAGDLTVAESDLIVAFGESSRGESLFPFNSEAIRMLTKRWLMKDGKIRFNPRRVIDHILHPVLKKEKSFFVNGKFPPANFEDANPSADISQWIAAAQVSSEIKERLKSLIEFWGGSPTHVKDVARMHPGLFKTFGLPTPEELGQERVVEVITKPEPIEAEKEGNKSVNIPDSEKWKVKLDEWSSGAELQQQDANKIRQAIGKAIEKRIDWNSLFMKKYKGASNIIIKIPNAKGNDAGRVFELELASCHKDPTGLVRKTLLAIINYELAGSNWDYEGGDEDSCLFANLIERLVGALESQLIKKRNEEIVPIVTVLFRQARFLGQLPKRLKHPDAYANVIVAPPLAIDRFSFPSEMNAYVSWYELRSNATQLMLNFREELFNRVACFQGDGQKVFAIDISSIPKDLIDFKEAVTEWPGTDKQTKGHIMLLQSIRLVPIIRKLVKELRKFYKLLTDTLGDDLDKTFFINNVKEFLDVLQKGSSWPEGDDYGAKKISNRIERVRLMPLNDLYENITPLLDEGIELSDDVVLGFIGRIDFVVLFEAALFLEFIGRFVSDSEREVKVLSNRFEGKGAVDEAKLIDDILGNIKSDLNLLSKSGG